MAKKDAAHDASLTAGRKMLEEWGISLARLHDQNLTLAAVTEHQGRNADANLAMAALLGSYATPESAQLLSDWESKTNDKPLRREIHRSLYKLAQKGIAVDRPQPEAARPIIAPIEPEGYLSTVDGHGDRLVWLVKPRVGGGLHYLSALVNEPEGMRYIEGTEIPRKAIRQMRQDLANNHQITMIEVDWRYCDFIMHEGYERAGAGNDTRVEPYPALRSHLLSSPAQPAPLPLPTDISVETIAGDEQALASSDQLLLEPEIQRWLLGHDEAHGYIEQINKAQESLLVLSPQQKQERVQTVVERAVTEVFGNERGRSYVRRLEETALHLIASQRREAATRALAVAQALKRSEHGGKGISFCEALVRQSIAVHYHEEQRQEQEESEGSLIMTPAQFSARVQAAQRRRK
jgi:hypothetical protein